MLRRLLGGGSERPPEPELPPREAIDRALLRLEGDPDGFAIFSVGKSSDTNRYVQVTQARPGELLGEAVGNKHLKGSGTLDPVALQTLATLGWSAAPDERSGNHTRWWPDWTGDGRTRVADDILSTLVLAFEMSPDGPLEISDDT